MVLSPFRFGIIQNDRHAVAGSFAQLHVTHDNRFEDQFLEVAFHFVVYLVGQAEPAVEHRQQKTFYLQFRVKPFLDNFDGV